MAEFTEIIKIWDRMCEGYDQMCITEDCPLSSLMNGKDAPCEYLFRTCPEEFERICLEWAKENPEITNADKLFQVVKESFGKDVAERIVVKLDLKGCNYVKCIEECSMCHNNNFWDKPYIEPKESE